MNFRTVEDENPQLKKEKSNSKKFDKNNKSDLKTGVNKSGIINEKSFLTEVDINIEESKTSEADNVQNY